MITSFFYISRKFFIHLSFILSLTLYINLSYANSEYIIGVAPQQSAQELASDWIPLLKKIEEKTGIVIKFMTAPTLDEFENRLANGEYDLSYMNPGHYVTFSEKLGYRALAMEKDRKLKGVLVVRKDSNINSVEQLKGTTIAYPSKAAYAASILIQTELHKRGINHNYKYVNSHSSVYLGVDNETFIAGGGVQRTFEMEDEYIRNNLKILLQTTEVTPHPIASLPRVKTSDQIKIQNALLSLNNDSEGQAILKAIGWRGITISKDEDYNDVRILMGKKLK